ncbi:hypothetical protein EMIHUDRAFT_247896 [Emiliania huxleyi CCMP1516]|uniref:Protein-serine/threonine kinase n=2 Tax=Emiliania huxleyi TaxID=2903 RepID=A0A0D3IJQ4_EMIH1|nr:hypothetical protein EMIHUDRAFT_247896 [Emiliania huxleyi CCMP1516]EOD11489.1 hypothetical protein EMIHUDRAFT_247896 [Emiliania huxleyi CCMP1516]|eukprot:XP_005763918.1 hypothetical protein EMIHUDRAFT_247896 [Emiliania huxleyi CCMP1516]
MRRFSRFDLLHIPAAELSAAFRKRLASHRAALGALRLPAAFDDATGHLVRGWDEASAQSSDADALAAADASAGRAVAAIRSLEPAIRSSPSAQALLHGTFSAIIGARALVQSAAAGASPEARRGMLLEGSLLSSLCADVIEDARAFCREKYGDSPEVRLQRVVASGGGDEPGTGGRASGEEGGEVAQADGVLVAPFVGFALHELLKNAMGAHCRSVGADCLDRLPPVIVRHGSRGGAPFEGLGMGLPLAALHARYHGGELHLRPAGQAGCHAAFSLRVAADAAEPEGEEGVSWQSAER